MILNTFAPVGAFDPITFQARSTVEDVQVYFCHHILSFVVFGCTCKGTCPACTKQGWVVRVTTNEQRNVPFEDVIEVPILGIGLQAVNDALERSLLEEVRCLKIQHKLIYRTAKREYILTLAKEHIKVELINPNTKETLHCFWQGSEFK